jgi:hypothetical protein
MINPNNRVIAIDASVWQSSIRTNELKAGGVELIIIRAASGTVEDKRFRLHTDNVLAEGGVKLAVYVWDDPILSSERQVDAWLKIIDPYNKYIDFIAPDLEQWWGVWGEWSEAIAKRLAWELVTRLDPLKVSRHYERTASYLRTLWTKKMPMYSSLSFVTQYAPDMKRWLVQYDNWVAHYANRPKEYTMCSWNDIKQNWLPSYTPFAPVPQEKVIGHQFTGDRMLVEGAYDWKGDRSPMDINVFDREWVFGNNDIISPDEPATDEIKALFSGIILPTVLNVRNNPSLGGIVIDKRQVGERVSIYELAGNDVWGKISPFENEWIALRKNTKLVDTICTPPIV